MTSFLRRRMRGLLRSTFSVPSTAEGVCCSSNSVPEGEDLGIEESEEELLMLLDKPSGSNGAPVTGLSGAASAPVYQRILNGRNGRRLPSPPEVYSGKTGLDLPSIHVAQFSLAVNACHSGPNGGLTRVRPMRFPVIAKMARLDDDEFSLSSLDEKEMDGLDFEEGGKAGQPLERHYFAGGHARANSLEALGFAAEDQPGTTSLDSLDWAAGWDELRAYGLSTSLYEKHPVTGMNAGHPIADVFGIIVRQNNAVLALADGVNWGEGARLAARCAVRGAMDHLNAGIERHSLATTTDVFHCLLGAFHSAHALILQEGGALTTLCVALVAPVRDSSSSVLCTCNVGDSLCFVYSEAHGVREVTLGSHDIAQMRDMRDAGGALGPVDGRNPQLQNLTCSMTFLEDGDLVFLTSDGISDNFDPVVGKFCVIRRPRENSSEKENLTGELPPATPGGGLFHKANSAPASHAFQLSAAGLPSFRPPKRAPAATLPTVDALERHELMLLRMTDVILNGLCPSPPCPSSLCLAHSHSCSLSSDSSSFPRPKLISAAELCRNLVQFAHQLSTAKRRTLEDPELYRTRTHSKTEERLRRKLIRGMIMEMPGKLDHASVVAYRVGRWPDRVERMQSLGCWEGGQEGQPTEPVDAKGTARATAGGGEAKGMGAEEALLLAQCAASKALLPPLPAAESVGKLEVDSQQHLAGQSQQSTAVQCGWPPSCDQNKAMAPLLSKRHQMNLANLLNGGNGSSASGNSPRQRPPQLRSPYEELPIGSCSGMGDPEEQQREANHSDELNSATECQLKSTIGKPKGARKGERHHHERGSQARHTLGVDVSWLKRLVTSGRQSGNGLAGNEETEQGRGAVSRGAERTETELPAALGGDGTRPTEKAVGSPLPGRTCGLRSVLGTMPALSSNALNNAGGKSLRRIQRAFARQPQTSALRNRDAETGAQEGRKRKPIGETQAAQSPVQGVVGVPNGVPRMGLGQREGKRTERKNPGETADGERP